MSIHSIHPHAWWTLLLSFFPAIRMPHRCRNNQTRAPGGPPSAMIVMLPSTHIASCTLAWSRRDQRWEGASSYYSPSREGRKAPHKTWIKCRNSGYFPLNRRHTVDTLPWPRSAHTLEKALSLSLAPQPSCDCHGTRDTLLSVEGRHCGLRTKKSEVSAAVQRVKWSRD